MSEANKTLMRKFHDGMHGANLAIGRELCSPDCTFSVFGNPPMGIEAHEGMVQAFDRAFPDAKITIDDIVADDERVAVRWTYRGTHTGDFQGMPASGKSFVMTGGGFDRIVGGKIVEHHAWGDMMGFLKQIGAMPA